MYASATPARAKVTTGGIVTVKDSTDNWYLSWTINRQPQFKAQDKNTVLVALFAEHKQRGQLCQKAMRDCTGEKVCREWLYHIGLPAEKNRRPCKERLQHHHLLCPISTPSSSPEGNPTDLRLFKTAPLTLPLSVSLQRPRDTIFTTEYSMRTGMESVYTLLDVDRECRRFWGSKYDVRGCCAPAIMPSTKAHKRGTCPLAKRLLKLVLKEGQGNRHRALQRKRTYRIKALKKCKASVFKSTEAFFLKKLTVLR